MSDSLPIRLPARKIALAASETLPAIALLLRMAPVSPDQAWIAYETVLLRIGAVAAIFLLCMYYYDLYDSPALRSFEEAWTRLPQVLGTACLVLAGLYLAAPSLRLRLAAVLLAMATLGLGVVVTRQIYFAMARSSRLARNYVLVGDSRLAEELTAILRSRPEIGIRIAAVFRDVSDMAGALAAAAKHSTSGFGCERIDGWIVASGESRLPHFADPQSGNGIGRSALDGAKLYETVTGKVWLESPDPIGRDKRNEPAGSGFPATTMRAASIVCSLFALILLAPLMAAIALVIWADSGRPIIFRQQRVGQNGRLFTLYKFRTMTNSESGPFRPAEKDDPRFTRAGRWLRRTRLDELPQIWNILRGEMSFLGPRPFAWEEERKWAREIPWYTERWKVKPGATGWAQIRRGYCSTREDNVEKLAYDLFYIKNQSPALNMLILFETTKILLKGRGAR